MVLSEIFRLSIRGLLLALMALLLGALSILNSARAAEPAANSAAIAHDLAQLRTTGSVLYIAAHPDDENTQLITYLARGRGYRTAYLSLTRGDGGQNVIGGEFGAQLGMIRTQELLAARRLDGAQQFFTRALDFGFSKDYQETLRIWDHQQVLADVVRVIRTFQPDVLITRFSPIPGGTHGHHTASAVLALEAFKLAGDVGAFPEQLGRLKPWQPKRILQNGRGEAGLTLDINGSDDVLGQSFAEIAGRSRAMHVSQGFAGYAGGAQSRPETFQLLDGAPATADILDGVETSWQRYAGGGEIQNLIDQTIEKFQSDNVAASVPLLLQLHAKMAALPLDATTETKRRELDRIIQNCVGLTVETTVAQAEIVPGETLQLSHRATVSSQVPVVWKAINVADGRLYLQDSALKAGQSKIQETSIRVPVQTPLSQPYWLRQNPTDGMARVANQNLIGLPENPPPFPISQVFEIGGQSIVVETAPLQVLAAGKTRALEIVPPVSLHFATPVRLFASATTRIVNVRVLAARADTAGTLRLQVPAGWKVQPPTQNFRLAKVGDLAGLAFQVTAPAQDASAEITAQATVNGIEIDTDRVAIDYPHLPHLLDQPKARTKAVVLDLTIRGREIGYLPGAGDSVAQALQEMGYNVTMLSGADLNAEKLRRFDAVMIGVRAFNVRSDLKDGLPALFAYVENGGNVIAQYNRPNDLKTPQIAPFDLKLSGLRVTDENAPVKFLVPEHPALNVPNKITQADFAGWVQERGIYFPDQWDARFTPLLSMSDPGEAALDGSLLVAQHGRGYFVYSGLVWFRQLPAGVPGAYRLLANLIALGR